jgi:hypothetical protein
MNNNFYILVTIIIVYLYLNRDINIPEFLIDNYNNRYIQMMFLLALLFFGNQNISLTIFLSLNWVLLGYKIQKNQLLKNI